MTDVNEKERRLIEENVELLVKSITPAKRRNEAAFRLRVLVARTAFGFLFAVVATWFFPPIFGTLGIALGRAVAHDGRPKLGLSIIVTNAVAMGVGIAYDIWFWIVVLGSPLPPW